MTWTPKTVWITAGGIGSLLLILPNLGKGLDSLVYVARVPSVAYAAKAQAETVDDKFNRYLDRQEAYTEALQKVVTQQQAPNRPAPLPIREQDAHEAWWCCDTTREDCWQRQTWRRCDAGD